MRRAWTASGTWFSGHWPARSMSGRHAADGGTHDSSFTDAQLALRIRYGRPSASTPLAEATQVTERLRATIPRIAIPGGGPVSPVPSGVTVSIGVAASAGAKRDLVDFLAAADHALYQAKNAGRNRVCIVSDETSSGPFPCLAARL